MIQSVRAVLSRTPSIVRAPLHTRVRLPQRASFMKRPVDGVHVRFSVTLRMRRSPTGNHAWN